MRGKRGLPVTWIHFGLDGSHLNKVCVCEHENCIFFLIQACKTFYFCNQGQM